MGSDYPKWFGSSPKASGFCSCEMLKNKTEIVPEVRAFSRSGSGWGLEWWEGGKMLAHLQTFSELESRSIVTLTPARGVVKFKFSLPGKSQEDLVEDGERKVHHPPPVLSIGNLKNSIFFFDIFLLLRLLKLGYHSTRFQI